MLRMHGMEPKYYHQFIGGNFRMDALQAAVVAVKLDHLDRWTRGRQRKCRPLPPAVPGGRLGRNDAIARRGPKPPHLQSVCHPGGPGPGWIARSYLAGQGIGTEVYYPVPLHMQTCFAYLGYNAGDFPESERAAAARTLALPIYPELQPASGLRGRRINAFSGG
jgi:dTDP-4-amino-4,6-dideoxygalactose transaminase